MYKNVEAEMLKHDISRATMAEHLGISYGTLCTRFAGQTSFSLKEAFMIRDLVAPGQLIEVLFPN